MLKWFIGRYRDLMPAVVARCNDSRDVAAALSFARRRHGLPIAIRSGAHSFAEHSSTEGLLIDLGGMRRIGIDRGVVRVGPGTRIGALPEHLAPYEPPESNVALVLRTSPDAAEPLEVVLFGIVAGAGRRCAATVQLGGGRAAGTNGGRGAGQVPLCRRSGGAHRALRQAHAYYGANLPRLRTVKAAYDPTGVFGGPQTIPES